MELDGNAFVEGIFLEESKNRFIGKVMVKDTICECYISSSSRLENFINMKNKRVLLSLNNRQDMRTKYSLFAVFYRNKLIILNLNIVNRLFESIIKTGKYKEYVGYNTVTSESEHEGYRADILLSGEEKLVVENKAIIDVRKSAVFPTVYSERAIRQLNKLDTLLCNGYKVYYNFIALSPFISSVRVNTDEEEYYRAFIQCVSHGIQVNGYKLYYEANTLKSKRIQIYI